MALGLPPLAAILGGTNTLALRRAAGCLELCCCDCNPLLPLLLAALDHPDAQVREAVPKGLRVPDADSTKLAPPLLRAVRDRSARVRAEAIWLLATKFNKRKQTLDALTGALRDRSPEVRKRALEGLKLLGRRAAAALPALLERFSEARADLREYQLVEAIKAVGPKAVPALRACLDDTSALVRQQALNVLDKIGARLPVATLLKLLRDPEADVRWVAATFSKRASENSSEVVAELGKMLDDPFARLRKAAATGLAFAGRKARAYLPLLVERTKDSDADVRARALWALRCVGLSRRELAPLCLAALQDSDRQVRSNAIQLAAAQGFLPDVPVAILVELLGDKDSEVRRRTIEALEKLGPRAREAVPALIRLLKRLRDFEQLRVTEALWRIARRQEPVMTVVVELLEQFDRGLSEGVCGLICDMGPAAGEAAPYLIELIESWPGDMDMQGSASEALCALGPEEVEGFLPDLIVLLHDRETASHMAPVLGGIPAAVPALIKALRDRSPVCREWAADALGRLGVAREQLRDVLDPAVPPLGRLDSSVTPAVLLGQPPVQPLHLRFDSHGIGFQV